MSVSYDLKYSAQQVAGNIPTDNLVISVESTDPSTTDPSELMDAFAALPLKVELQVPADYSWSIASPTSVAYSEGKLHATFDAGVARVKVDNGPSSSQYFEIGAEASVDGTIDGYEAITNLDTAAPELLSVTEIISDAPVAAREFLFDFNEAVWDTSDIFVSADGGPAIVDSSGSFRHQGGDSTNLIYTTTQTGDLEFQFNSKVNLVGFEVIAATVPELFTKHIDTNSGKFLGTDWIKLTFDGDLYGSYSDYGADLSSGDTNVQGSYQWFDGDGFVGVMDPDVFYGRVINTNVTDLDLAVAADDVDLYFYNVAGGGVNISGLTFEDRSGNAFVPQAEEVAPKVRYTVGMQPIVSTVDDDDVEDSSFSVMAGTATTFDVLDLSAITTGPMLILAETNLLEVYDYLGNLSEIGIFNYEKFILNDRSEVLDVNGDRVYGNMFVGTDVSSEYVVVGSGGDNLLEGGNRDILEEYTDNSVPETDVVDYSRIDVVGGAGIKVELGNRGTDGGVTVTYLDATTDADRLYGFEGVVGSGGDDYISGSNVGNFLAGGEGDDVLRGYTDSDSAKEGAQDKLYDDTSTLYAQLVTDELWTEEQRLDKIEMDKRDVLFGGGGYDELYGGAGTDMLIDLDAALMKGSDKTGLDAAGGAILRASTDSVSAEQDIFVVRGVGSETATIENFHLSEDGTGLAGRSGGANDRIVFSIDAGALGLGDYANILLSADIYSEAEMQELVYEYVYSRLDIRSEVVANLDDGAWEDLEVSAYYGDKSVASVRVADAGAELGRGNAIESVKMKRLSDMMADPLRPDFAVEFSTALDWDAILQADGSEFLYDINIAFALELLQAGTVRGANEYGVMAAKLADLGLGERVYNPGDDDESIVGTIGDDSYKFIVQSFNEDRVDGDNDSNLAGDDTIFDLGGTKDVLTFADATLEGLQFSATRSGRESGENSLKVTYTQDAVLDDGGTVTNTGTVTWQGHFKDGGRQAAEMVTIKDGTFVLGQASYEHDDNGYRMGGPKILANSDNADVAGILDSIMVGQYNGADRLDTFVFNSSTSLADAQGSDAPIKQTAHIWNAGANDTIDLTAYEDIFGEANVAAVSGGKSMVTFADDSNFTLELSFKGVADDLFYGDLNFVTSAS